MSEGHPSVGGECVPTSSIDLAAGICLREQVGEMDVSFQSVEWFWCPHRAGIKLRATRRKYYQITARPLPDFLRLSNGLVLHMHRRAEFHRGMTNAPIRK